MDIRKLLKAKMSQIRQELRQQYIDQQAKEAAKNFDDEFKSLFEDDGIPSIAQVKTKPKAKKVLKGFTRPEELVGRVKKILAGGPKSKKEIALEILQMGGLTKLDLSIHSDGTYRYYKSLDRTRRLMMDRGELVNTPNGDWMLA